MLKIIDDDHINKKLKSIEAEISKCMEKLNEDFNLSLQWQAPEIFILNEKKMRLTTFLKESKNGHRSLDGLIRNYMYISSRFPLDKSKHLMTELEDQWKFQALVEVITFLADSSEIRIVIEKFYKNKAA